MALNRFARSLGLPILSAAVVGGAALGLAGMAHADYEFTATPGGGYSTGSDPTDSVDSAVSNSGNFSSPTVYAEPATTWVPWASTLNGYSN